MSPDFGRLGGEPGKRLSQEWLGACT